MLLQISELDIAKLRLSGVALNIIKADDGQYGLPIKTIEISSGCVSLLTHDRVPVAKYKGDSLLRNLRGVVEHDDVLRLNIDINTQ